jgi:predicted small secreted protein
MSKRWLHEFNLRADVPTGRLVGSAKGVKRIMKTFGQWVWIVWACAVIAGCNTVSGVGKDLQKAGEKLEEAAKKNK